MLRIGPLNWSNMNPSAPAFEPKNSRKELNNESTNKEVINPSKEVNRLTTASTSKVYLSKNKNRSKPSVLTLDQFIAEKLKIEGNSNKFNNNSNDRNEKKTKKLDISGVPLNSLDSSAPTRKRGKEREVPKPKKPTALKKIIMNEKMDKNCDSKTDSQNCPQNNSLEEINKRLLHSKSYREYCDQRLAKTVDQLVIDLLSDLVTFQDKMYSRDPLKAKIKKRLCFGFNEVIKYAKIDKIKLLVIAPDIEKIQSKGGLDDRLSHLITICKTNTIPIIFALKRKSLAITTKKKGFVSCVGVLNIDGTQENYKQLISLCETERNEYKSIFDQSLSELKALSEQQIQQIVNELPNIPKHFTLFHNSLNPRDRRDVKFRKI